MQSRKHKNTEIIRKKDFNFKRKNFVVHCFNRVCFIDASNEFVREGNKNKLSDENIEKIYDVHFNKTEILDAVSPKLLPWTLYCELIRIENADSCIKQGEYKI